MAQIGTKAMQTKNDIKISISRLKNFTYILSPFADQTTYLIEEMKFSIM